MTPVLSPEAIARVLEWGSTTMRDLPWRRTRDPWAILVSEVMLQQTGVERVIPKWSEFLDAYPTPAACAGGATADVLRMWQGLGYPRRALNLQAAARRIAAMDQFPSTLADLLGLDGVGPYTARAVRAFAFEETAAVVDTNIARIFARVSGRSLSTTHVQAAADAAVPPTHTWAWNQILIDVGALLCRPQRPRCDACPLRPDCAHHGVGADPAVGSAAVSVPQGRFEGSDRQGRGRLLKALGRSPVASGDLAAAMGWPDQHERADRVATAMVRDRLAVRDGERYRLP